MAGTKISELPVATTLTGAELVPVVQSGATKQTTLAQMPYVPDGTGAVTTTVQDKLRETVSVKDFGAVGDGVTDDTAAIQAALDSGAKNVLFPWTANGYAFTTFTVPQTVKLIEGGSGHRGGVQLKAIGTATSAIVVSSDGINVKNLYLDYQGTYTNGIVYSSGYHYATWENVTTNGAFPIHWLISDNCWSQSFYHCGAWGNDAGVGIRIGSAGNSLDFHSCRFVHCAVGVYVYGNSCESINFFGGEIASNTAFAGVRIGQGASSSGIENISFYGTYFEDQPINIYNDQTDTVGINCVSCRNSATSTAAHIFLNRKANSVVVFGGVYNSIAPGATIVDMNNTASPGVTIVSPYVSGMSGFANNGSQPVNYISISDNGSLALGNLKFPATQVSSSNPNTLDDYEEGTWTPTDASGAGLTLATAAGYYTKVGRIVTATFRVVYPTTANGANAAIGGLPFASANATDRQHQGGGLRYTNAGVFFTFANNPVSTDFALIDVSGVGVTNATLSAKIVDGMVIYNV